MTRTVRVLQFDCPQWGKLVRVNVDYPDEWGPGVLLAGDDWHASIPEAVSTLNRLLPTAYARVTETEVLAHV